MQTEFFLNCATPESSPHSHALQDAVVHGFVVYFNLVFPRLFGLVHSHIGIPENIFGLFVDARIHRNPDAYCGKYLFPIYVEWFGKQVFETVCNSDCRLSFLQII